MKLPPTIMPQKNVIIAMCRICWDYYSAPINRRKKVTVKKEAIKGIRHRKYCLYDKKQIDRCVEIVYPPK